MEGRKQPDDKEAKRIRKKRETIKEILLTEYIYKQNLDRMANIIRDDNFRNQFDSSGLFLKTVTEIADRTTDVIKKKNNLYKGTAWETMNINTTPELLASGKKEGPDAILKRVGNDPALEALVDRYSKSPKELRKLVRVLTKAMMAQFECTLLANKYIYNPDIPTALGQKIQTEIVNEFKIDMNPILLTQRFNKYTMLLIELQKHAGHYPKIQRCLDANINKANELGKVLNSLTSHLDLLNQPNRHALLENIQNPPRWKAAKNIILEITTQLDAINEYAQLCKLQNDSTLIQNLLRPIELMISAKLATPPISEEIYLERLRELQPAPDILDMLVQFSRFTHACGFVSNSEMVQRLMEPIKLVIDAKYSDPPMITENPDAAIKNIEPALRIIDLCALNNLPENPIVLLKNHIDTMLGINNVSNLSLPELPDILKMPIKDVIILASANPQFLNCLNDLVCKIKLSDLTESKDPNVKLLVQFLGYINEHSNHNKIQPHGTLRQHAQLSLSDLFSNALNPPSVKPKRTLSDSYLNKSLESNSPKSVRLLGMFASSDAKVHSKVINAIKTGAKEIFSEVTRRSPPNKAHTN